MDSERSTNWTKAKISEFCRVGDGAHGSLKRYETGIMYLTSKNFKDDGLDLSKVDYINEQTYQKYFNEKSSAFTKPSGGDVLFSIIGSIGSPYVVKSTDHFGISSSVAMLRPNSSVLSSKYLYYWIKGQTFQNALYGIKGGVAQGYVSLEMIKSLPLYYPPLPTQHRIAEILWAYDELIEVNTRRIRILEGMAQSIYQEWFGKVDAESLPDKWKLVTIGDITNPYRGRSYGSDNLVEDGGLPFLNLKCLARDGGFRPDGLKWYKGIFKENQTAKAGDIVMGLTDMTQERRIVARAARVPNMGINLFVMSMDLLKISPKPDIHNTYLYALLRFSGFADEVKQHANGANVLHLSPERIEQYQFALPPETLRNKFGEIAEPLYMQCDVLERKNANLRKTSDLLLPLLVGGEIEV
ncbi:MAG: restriction endonuclease subunit S [Chloroflexi bacterium]|nr:restriction endonuclease subunit S [Chloroflexota bacterium]